MPSHPLTPAQALWQHYNAAPQQDMTSVRTNPVHQKELYARLHHISRATRTTNIASLVTPPVSKLSTNWQEATTKQDEGLGLSEM
jgi:hypothetical protein